MTWEITNEPVRTISGMGALWLGGGLVKEAEEAARACKACDAPLAGAVFVLGAYCCPGRLA